MYPATIEDYVRPGTVAEALEALGLRLHLWILGSLLLPCHPLLHLCLGNLLDHRLEAESTGASQYTVTDRQRKT